MSIKGTRAAIASERKRVRAKVQPEIDAHWAEVEARQAQDAAESRAIVATHREREVRIQEARRRKAEAEEAEWQKILTGEQEPVLLSGEPPTGPTGAATPESKEKSVVKLANGKKVAAAKAPAAKTATKTAKAKTFCLMTGRETNGTNFSGLGTDAKYKSLLINTALSNPHGEVTIHDHATGKPEKREAIAILRQLGWLPMLEKARDARKAKVEASNAKSAAKVAAKPAKKAAGTVGA